MYVRFKVSSGSSNGHGMKGMVETLRAVATASAGASISQPAGTSEFHVVSNNEAGGWTVADSTSPTYTYNNFTGSIRLESPTNKTGYTKSFQVTTNSSTSNPTYYGALICRFLAYDGSTARYNAPLSYNASNSTGTNGTQMWMPNNGLYQDNLTWHFACTADYVYLWFTHNGDRDGMQNNFAGVSELQNVPSYQLGTGNAFFPAVGFYSGSNNDQFFGSSTTSYYHDYYAHSIHGSFPNADDGPFDYVNQNNIQYTGSGGFTTNDQPMQMGPYYYQGASLADNDNYNYKPIFNADGDKVGALVPPMYFNPYRGIPFTTLAGFYYYEPFQRSDNSYKAIPYYSRQNEIIYDDTGAKYSLQYQKEQYGIRAFRAE